MSSVSLNPTMFPDEVNLNIFSFLGTRELNVAACSCRTFNQLTQDFQIWKPRVESEFGKIVSQGAKEPTKSWKKTYEELVASRQMRTANVAQVLQAHVNKTQADEERYMTEQSAFAILGLPAPAFGTHYVPTSWTVLWGARKITIFRSMHQ